MRGENEDAHSGPVMSTNLMFSIIVECQGASDGAIAKFIHCLGRQDYRNFEVIFVGIDNQRIVDTMPKIPRGFTTTPEFALNDIASQSRLTLLRGEFLLILSASDELSPTALRKIKQHVQEATENLVDVVMYDYTNLDSGETSYIPGWDPDLLAYRDYIGRAFAIRLEVVRGLVNKSSIKSTYQLLKSAAEGSLSVLHIPETLVGMGRMTSDQAPFALSRDVIPPFSIVIPNRNGMQLLPKCVEFLEEIDAEIDLIIVDNHSDDPQIESMYAHIQKRFGARIFKFDRSFNYSAMINLGVENAVNEQILLLNNDVHIRDSMVVGTALSYATRPDVGIVGSVLRYPDGRVQHAGIVLSRPTGEDFDTSHVLRFAEFSEGFHIGALTAPRNWQCVTGAFQVVRRSVFISVGGYDEVNLPIEFNDIDFCLRVRSAGLKVVCLPLPGIVHDESHTRSKIDKTMASQLSKDAYQVMRARWADCYENDPYFNAQLRGLRAEKSQKVKSSMLTALQMHINNLTGMSRLRITLERNYIARAGMALRLKSGVCIVAPFGEDGRLGNFSRSIADACDRARIEVSFVSTTSSDAISPSNLTDLLQPFSDRVTAVYVCNMQMLSSYLHVLGEGRKKVLILPEHRGTISESNLRHLRQFEEVWVSSALDSGKLREELGHTLRVLPASVEQFLNLSSDWYVHPFSGRTTPESEAVDLWIRNTFSD